MVNYNQLSGSIPTEFGNCEPMRLLYLHNNKLTGTVPSEIGNLSKLVQFLGHENELTGSISFDGPICGLLFSEGLSTIMVDCISEVICECCTYCY